MPHRRGSRLQSQDLDQLCDLVFPTKKTELDRKEFCEMFQASGQICDIFDYLGKMMSTAIQSNQARNLERTHVRALIRKLFLDINKDVFRIVEERAAQKQQKKKESLN